MQSHWRIHGVFKENSFIFFSQVGMLTVDISKKGDVDGILSNFDEGVPPFLADLIRDFPGRHYWSDRVLLYRLREETAWNDVLEIINNPQVDEFTKKCIDNLVNHRN